MIIGRLSDELAKLDKTNLAFRIFAKLIVEELDHALMELLAAGEEVNDANTLSTPIGELHTRIRTEALVNTGYFKFSPIKTDVDVVGTTYNVKLRLATSDKLDGLINQLVNLSNRITENEWSRVLLLFVDNLQDPPGVEFRVRDLIQTIKVMKSVYVDDNPVENFLLVFYGIQRKLLLRQIKTNAGESISLLELMREILWEIETPPFIGTTSPIGSRT